MCEWAGEVGITDLGIFLLVEMEKWEDSISTS